MNDFADHHKEERGPNQAHQQTGPAIDGFLGFSAVPA
jgi:hypothetical protein